MYRYIKASISLEDVDHYAHDVFNDVMRIVDYKDAKEHKIDSEIRNLILKDIPNPSEDDIENIIDMVYENIDSYFARNFGEVRARKYGDLIYNTFNGQYISKEIAKADKPGGLTYSANQIGLTTFQLLEALEGMCRDGRVVCVDDSTYYVGEY